MQKTARKSSSKKRKTTRKRPAPKSERPEAALEKSAEVQEQRAIIKTRSPAARIEQNDDSIVISFPPLDESPDAAELAATPEKTPPAQKQLNEVEAGVESSIDWDEAESPTDASPSAPIEPASPDSSDDDSSLRGAEAPSSAQAAEQATAEPKRGRSRRRRRKKTKTPTETPDAARTDQVEADSDRKRPEQTDESAPASDAESAEQAEPSRKRRSRRGRGRGSKGKAAASAEVHEETAAPDSRAKEMIINVSPHEECRIAIMDGGKLQEIYLERSSSENLVGNIYKGIITNVESSIQAAFVDFGLGKNGFLHISDLHPQYFPNGEGGTENVGRKMPRRSRPPIQRCLRRGQQVLVQITKEGIGTKGPTLTTYLSIPGRFLVMMPGMRQLGVSRKIEDDDERRKLKQQLVDLELPDNAGFIARTAALDHTKRELQSDLNYLSRLWKSVDNRIKNQKAPAELYTESDLVTRTIRDVYTSDIARILIDDADVAKRAHEFISIFSPRSRDIVVHYDEPTPIFHRYGIEEELERLHSRHVPLESGGSLVIDQTEALVAIDINSGRFRTEDDAETTAYKIDLEAADEIPRQLRLRDLGGVVVCDFIDVRMEKHKREIERRLIRNLKEHKERAKVLRMSEFGLIELTRQRQRASLTRNVYKDCAHCRGTGLVKTAESVTLDVMRIIQLATTRDNIATIDVTVSTEVADLLLNRKRTTLHELETKKQRKISVHSNSEFGLDQISVKCNDQRGRLISSF